MSGVKESFSKAILLALSRMVLIPKMSTDDGRRQVVSELLLAGRSVPLPHLKCIRWLRSNLEEVFRGSVGGCRLD